MINKLNISIAIDKTETGEHVVENNENVDETIEIEEGIEENFCPNLDKDLKGTQEEKVNEIFVEMPKPGKFVKDLKWTKGFFLKTFPHLFICNKDYGGDIT